MRRVRISTIAFFVCALVSTAAFAVETIRIHMGDWPGEVVLKGDGLSFGTDVEEGSFTPLSDSVQMTLRDGQLMLQGQAANQDSVRFRTAGVGITAGGKQVRGEVVVLVHKNALRLINVLPLEEYLAAVLGSEMPKSFPLEALKAQAVAARTYALRKKLDSYGESFHLGSSVLHQVYGGLSREDARTLAAVLETSGQVLTFDLQPIEAYFHASCGGQTETGLSALGRNLPYLASVSCPCGQGASSHWSLTLGASEVRALFGKDARAVRVAGRTSTGRALRVESGEYALDAVTFRKRVGYDRLKSLAFDVERHGADNGLRIVGRGYGHGAGMCQWGAKALAEKGMDYRQILEHYYPGVDLQQIY